MKQIVLIPAYCPDRKILDLIQELRQRDLHCLIVDDGSPSEYQEIFALAEAEVKILHHPSNRGKGAALKTGMEYLYQNESDCVIVCADADGQHLPEDILRCAEAAESEDFVLGSRIFEKEKMPSRSWYGNKISAFFFALSTGTEIRDTQSGLRAFRREMIPLLLKAEGERYEYEMNQLFLLCQNGRKITPVDIQAVYEGNNECSHFRPVRDSLRIFRRIFLFLFSSLSAFLLDTTLFAFFCSFFGGAYAFLAANILARICSAFYNYEFNRRAVFADDSSRKKSLLRYALLAVMILTLNSLLLTLLHQGLQIPVLMAKILTETILFTLSWILQHRFVFKETESEVTAS
ncbi:MAG: bifunctional glycosyltransferase family 2/GtrA family protein [Erysipelotrichaceae bacterium]|nr:bifunctional glycosyltransferase family 2/GtrA family protein [Erysipelotrichaceae bacterium]